jgi:hypothetical protein
MTVSIHLPRHMEEKVPPGTWEGTKQDAVLATAQLLEVLSRKKSGEKTGYGESEYDSQMANAQLRAFKLTKALLRQARRKSACSDIPIMIEDMGFGTPDHAALPRPARPPPTQPLPSPPVRSMIIVPNRAKSRSPSGRKKKSQSPVRSATPVSLTSSGTPPPIPPRKSSQRHSSALPPALVVPPRALAVPAPFSGTEEVSPRSSVPQIPSPLPRSVSPRRQGSLPPVAEHDDLPVQPFRRVRFGSDDSSNGSRSPLPESSPSLSPLSVTAPLVPKRGSLNRSYSFRFGEGLQNRSLSRTSSMICSELSDALKDLQRTIGAVEVH